MEPAGAAVELELCSSKREPTVSRDKRSTSTDSFLDHDDRYVETTIPDRVGVKDERR
jgi:hypothetical protein